MKRLAILALLLVACSPITNYTPATEAIFEARSADHPIDFFPDGTKPDREYTLVGMGDVRADDWGEALKTLKPLARKHGADAIIAGAVTQIFMSVATYQGTFVRYKK